MSLDISKLFNGRDLKEESLPNKNREKKPKQIDERYSAKSTSSSLLHFRIEKRRGKTITLVGYFHIDNNLKKELLQSLKKELSTGGTIRGDYLEFQGDLRDRLKNSLLQRGYQFKK